MVENEALKPKLRIVWGKLVPGAILGVIVAATVVADIWNNAGFAYASMGPGAAVVAGALGLMVGLAPIVAYFIGWDKALRAASGFCTLACILFAMFAYGEKNGAQQGEKARAGLSLDDANSARQEARDARAEAARISEVASVTDLEALQASAKSALDSADKAAKKQGIECTQSRRCRDERKAMDKTIERLGQARAKVDVIARAEKAEGRVSTAKGEAREAGTANANAMASILSSWFHLDVRTTEQQGNFFLMLILIGSTLSIAYLGEHAAKLLAEAFITDQPKPAKTVRQTIARKAEPVALPPSTKGLSGFMSLCKHGEPTAQKDIREAVDRYWVTTKQAGEPPSDRALGMALVKHGFEKVVDRRKCVSYAIKLPDVGLKLVAGLAN